MVVEVLEAVIPSLKGTQTDNVAFSRHRRDRTVFFPLCTWEEQVMLAARPLQTMVSLTLANHVS